MTELMFYKFISENDIEYRWDYNRDTKKNDVIIWVPFYLLEAFSELIEPDDHRDGGGVEVAMKSSCVALFANEILDPFNIELENIFKKESE